MFILSAVTPLVVGFNIDSKEESTVVRDPLEDYYGVYSLKEIPEDIRPVISEEEVQEIPVINDGGNSEESPVKLDGLMDSPWPMYCHDTRHTGRSLYSTVNTQDEIWRFKQQMNDYFRGSPIIGDDGTIYIGGMDFYALYPNGAMKWKFDLWLYVWSAPAIANDGTIYIGTVYGDSNYFWALNSNGSLKWRYKTNNIFSSPAIGLDGTIYFGDENHYINAVWPNGTLRWRYKTGNVVYSSPAIGADGTVYCGSHDTYLYALYPNNGTLKWKYKTGHWVRVSPCIGDDGTIYVVSLDDYLHAVNPNGTLKWKTDVGAGTSPTIGQDGTIYCGYTQLYAVNPTNGSVKWTFDNSGKITGSTPCHSLEDTIYFGAGSYLFAVNSDGTLKWQKKITNEFIDSAPAIAEDGTIYVGTAYRELIGGSIYNIGFFHAFGKLDPNAPSVPDINGPSNGKTETKYEYKIKSTSPLGRDVYFWIEWDDLRNTGWIGPYGSGEEVIVSHSWLYYGTYNIRIRVKDTDNLWGPWGELTVTMPRDKSVSSSIILSFLEKFPLLEKLLNLF